jgi:hypothetical protein
MTAKSDRNHRALGIGVVAALLAVACSEGAPRAAAPRGARGTAAATAQAPCSPRGAHPKHAFTICTTCHACQGVVAFDQAGPAYAMGTPAPIFDATAKICTNVACHGVASGTYTYSSWDWGLDQPVDVTVSYGGTLKTTPSWYTTGAGGCTACHDDPPRNNVWHSGYHGAQGPTGARNQCQFCHPDASSSGNGIGDTITNPSLHANGKVEVHASYSSVCFTCH